MPFSASWKCAWTPFSSIAGCITDPTTTGASAHAAQHGKKGCHVSHVVQDKAGKHAIERRRLEGQWLGEVVFDESDFSGSSFLACLSQHARREVNGCHSCALLGEWHGVATSAAGHVEQRQSSNFTQKARDVRLLKQQQGI